MELCFLGKKISLVIALFLVWAPLSSVNLRSGGRANELFLSLLGFDWLELKIVFIPKRYTLGCCILLPSAFIPEWLGLILMLQCISYVIIGEICHSAMSQFHYLLEIHMSH